MPTSRCQGTVFQGGEPLDYIHYSVVMHANRRIALFTAHNIDGGRLRSVPRTGWDLDRRAENVQTSHNEFDFSQTWNRGHLVRRAAVAWGDTEQRAKDASDSTFYYTNAVPQHAGFNQDEWLELEDLMLSLALSHQRRLCVFTGPLYTHQDPVIQGLRVPAGFWKVVVLRDPSIEGDDLSVLGFFMKQPEMWDDFGSGSLEELALYQVGVSDLGRAAGIDFGVLAALDEFEWRQPRFRDRSRMKPIRIKGPDDIKFFGARRRSIGIRAIRVGAPPDEVAAPPTASRADCGCGPADTESTIRQLSQKLSIMQELLDDVIEDRQESIVRDRRAMKLRDAYWRIVGGEKVASDTFEEVCCLGQAGPFGFEGFCSGVLVRPRVVLTAAHCLPTSIRHVFLKGSSVHLPELAEIVEVESVMVYPGYDGTKVPSHDIMVVILKNDAHTAPAKLAERADVDAQDDTTLVGFGYEDFAATTGFGTKRQVNVQMTREAPAVMAELGLKLGFDDAFEFHAGRKGLGKDSCKGDSGGPAYITAGGELVVAGLTSRAAYDSVKTCGDGGIYTRITPYLEWIADVTNDESFHSKPKGSKKKKKKPAADAPVPTVAARLPYISAALPNPVGTDAGAEWVELTNPSAAPISLTGWSIGDDDGGSMALSGPIGPGQTRRFVMSSEVKLGNRGDTIILRRGGDPVHEVTYGKAPSGQLFGFAQPESCGEPTDTGPDDDLTPTFAGAESC